MHQKILFTGTFKEEDSVNSCHTVHMLHEDKLTSENIVTRLKYKILTQPANLLLCEADHTIPHIHQYPAAGSPAY